MERYPGDKEDNSPDQIAVQTAGFPAGSDKYSPVDGLDIEIVPTELTA